MKTKKAKELVEKWLAENAEKNDYLGYGWKLGTIAGDLHISLHEPEPREKVFSVFTRFDNPKSGKAVVGIGCNPLSGKWNFHQLTKGKTPEELSEFPINELESIKE